MNRKIDGYIIRKFLGTFFSAIALIVIIIIVFDISEKLGIFVEKKVPIRGIIVDYYLNFLPFLVNMFSFLFIFIAVIFFTSRLAQNSEIISILSSGISFRRMLVPYIISALLIGLLNSLLANFVIPNVTKDRLAFERAFMRGDYINANTNIHIRYNDSTYFYVETFNHAHQAGYKFTEEIFDKERLLRKFHANQIQYDSLQNVWKAIDYVDRVLLKDGGEKITQGASIDLKIPLTPLDFSTDYLKVEEMNFSELNHFITQEKDRGSYRVKFYEYERWQRFMHPFASVILTLIGVALSARKSRRGGMGLNLSIGISLAFTFILFMQFSKVFATFGNFPVWLAVWIPIILYGFIALGLLRSTPK